jgi:hypothetical protein
LNRLVAADIRQFAQPSQPLLLMNCATDRADTKLGSAEIQVVCAIAPVRVTDAEDILAVRGLDIAHPAVAAPGSFQA